MSQRKSIIRGGTLLAGNQLATQVLRFTRNIILARLLSPEDFGIAATFWITTAFFAVVTQLGVEQMLIRDKEGDDERVGATGQSLLAVRGALIGLTILLLSDSIMSLLGAPEAANAFRWIALSTVIGSLAHRDMVRMQRHMRFGPAIVSQLAPDLVVTLLAWPIAVWCRDYRAFVVFAVLQSVLTLVASLVVAERPYRLAWDPVVIRKYLHFGWPLVLNSLLMFVVLQGDRIVLAQAYSMAELGLYSVALGLAMTPGNILMGIGSQLMLPTLAKSQDNRLQFDRQYELFAAGLGAMAAAMGILFLLSGPALIRLIYGDKYDAAATVVGLLGVMQGIRLLRVATTTAALALGDSRNSLLANAVRQCGLALAVMAALWQMPLTWVAGSGIVGEILAAGASAAWTWRAHRLPLGPTLTTGALLSTGLMLAYLVSDNQDRFSCAVWGILLVVAIPMAIVLSCDSWRKELGSSAKRVRLLLIGPA